MRDKRALGKFELDPNYNRAEDIRNSIETFRTEAYRKLNYLDTITDATFQLLGLFSMIDSMAQEWSEYDHSKNPGEHFCDFVLKHQHKCDYLDKVDPATLYYHVEELIGELPPFPSISPVKKVSLDSLGCLDMRLAKDVIKANKADEILKHVALKKGDDFAKQKAKEHRLIALIYRMRSKAVHEMTGLGEEAWHNKEYNFKEPYYRVIGRIYEAGFNIISDDVCELSIPNCFIRSILADCLDGYLTECAALGKRPFENNLMTRKHRLSWYDK